MARFERYAPGQFSWVDLMSLDRERSSAFYGALFGWEVDHGQDDHGGRYSMFRLGELELAGMGEMDDAMRASGVPPSWSSYVTVEDLDAATDRARTLGAQILVPPLDLTAGGEAVGRMAILADPEGAAISLWQAGRHVGAGMTNEPGGFGWNELCSRDVDAARRFYGELVGWTFHGDEAGYLEIRLDGRANGGILPWRPEMGAMPPAWSVYFSVHDCDASTRRVQELGGQVLVPPTDIEAGRFSVVADPGGAVFDLMKIDAPD